jgi:predicted acyl esterase
MAAEFKPTHPSETTSGHNDIAVKSVQFGLQPIIMEKDIAVPVRDGHVLYANVFRPKKEGRYPVVIAGALRGFIHRIRQDISC